MKRTIGLILILLALVLALAAVMGGQYLDIRAPEHENARGNEYESIVTVVFRPLTSGVASAAYFGSLLVEAFRPSNLSEVGCNMMPSNPSRLPLKALRKWAYSCRDK